MQRILSEGPTITIVFKAAEGLEAGKTAVRYKDVSIGQVTAVQLSPDYAKVEVTAKIVKSAASLMVEDAKFWVVEPRVTLSGVSGLGTLLSGNYIGLEVGKSGKQARRFTGLETPPPITGGQPGRQFVDPRQDRGEALMHRLLAVVIPSVLAVLAAACASTPSRFYQLSANSSTPGPASSLSVAVGPVAVPASVDRPQVVVIVGPNQVRLDEFNRWAAPVQNEIARVVAENLVAMLGAPRVTISPQTLAAGADYRAAIEVQRFESTPGQAATLDAVWTVSRAKDGRAQTSRTTVREPAQEQGYDALVAAHSRAVARLSQAIADAVRGLERSAP